MTMAQFRTGARPAVLNRDERRTDYDALGQTGRGMKRTGTDVDQPARGQSVCLRSCREARVPDTRIESLTRWSFS